MNAIVTERHIEPLEARDGTLAELTEADRLFDKHPSALTDRHLRLIAAYDPHRARQGFVVRQKALALRGPTVSRPFTDEEKWAAIDQVGDAIADFVWADTEDERNKSIDSLYDAFVRADATLRPVEMLLPVSMWLRSMNQKNIERNARIESLEKQLDALQSSQLADRHKGVWTHDQIYRRGDLALSGGSSFICLEDGCTAVMPGTNGDKWRLFAQRGRPGKDEK